MNTENEIYILQNVSHCPSVAPLQYFLELDDIIIIVIPFYRNSNLQDFILKKNKVVLDNQKIYNIIYNLSKGLKCIHTLGIIHRKLNCLLYTSPSPRD